MITMDQTLSNIHYANRRSELQALSSTMLLNSLHAAATAGTFPGEGPTTSEHTHNLPLSTVAESKVGSVANVNSDSSHKTSTSISTGSSTTIPHIMNEMEIEKSLLLGKHITFEKTQLPSNSFDKVYSSQHEIEGVASVGGGISDAGQTVTAKSVNTTESFLSRLRSEDPAAWSVENELSTDVIAAIESRESILQEISILLQNLNKFYFEHGMPSVVSHIDTLQSLLKKLSSTTADFLEAYGAWGRASIRAKQHSLSAKSSGGIPFSVRPKRTFGVVLAHYGVDDLYGPSEAVKSNVKKFTRNYEPRKKKVLFKFCGEFETEALAVEALEQSLAHVPQEQWIHEDMLPNNNDKIRALVTFRHCKRHYLVRNKHVPNDIPCELCAKEKTDKQNEMFLYDEHFPGFLWRNHNYNEKILTDISQFQSSLVIQELFPKLKFEGNPLLLSNDLREYLTTNKNKTKKKKDALSELKGKKELLYDALVYSKTYQDTVAQLEFEKQYWDHPFYRPVVYNLPPETEEEKLARKLKKPKTVSKGDKSLMSLSLTEANKQSALAKMKSINNTVTQSLSLKELPSINQDTMDASMMTRSGSSKATRRSSMLMQQDMSWKEKILADISEDITWERLQRSFEILQQSLPLPTVSKTLEVSVGTVNHQSSSFPTTPTTTAANNFGSSTLKNAGKNILSQSTANDLAITANADHKSSTSTLEEFHQHHHHYRHPITFDPDHLAAVPNPYSKAAKTAQYPRDNVMQQSMVVDAIISEKGVDMKVSQLRFAPIFREDDIFARTDVGEFASLSKGRTVRAFEFQEHLYQQGKVKEEQRRHIQNLLRQALTVRIDQCNVDYVRSLIEQAKTMKSSVLNLDVVQAENLIERFKFLANYCLKIQAKYRGDRARELFRALKELLRRQREHLKTTQQFAEIMSEQIVPHLVEQALQSTKKCKMKILYRCLINVSGFQCIVSIFPKPDKFRKPIELCLACRTNSLYARFYAFERKTIMQRFPCTCRVIRREEIWVSRFYFPITCEIIEKEFSLYDIRQQLLDFETAKANYVLNDDIQKRLRNDYLYKDILPLFATRTPPSDVKTLDSGPKEVFVEGSYTKASIGAAKESAILPRFRWPLSVRVMEILSSRSGRPNKQKYLLTTDPPLSLMSFDFVHMTDTDADKRNAFQDKWIWEPIRDLQVLQRRHAEKIHALEIFSQHIAEFNKKLEDVKALYESCLLEYEHSSMKYEDKLSVACEELANIEEMQRRNRAVMSFANELAQTIAELENHLLLDQTRSTEGYEDGESWQNMHLIIGMKKKFQQTIEYLTQEKDKPMNAFCHLQQVAAELRVLSINLQVEQDSYSATVEEIEILSKNISLENLTIKEIVKQFFSTFSFPRRLITKINTTQDNISDGKPEFVEESVKPKEIANDVIDTPQKIIRKRAPLYSRRRPESGKSTKVRKQVADIIESTTDMVVSETKKLEVNRFQNISRQLQTLPYHLFLIRDPLKRLEKEFRKGMQTLYSQIHHLCPKFELKSNSSTSQNNRIDVRCQVSVYYDHVVGNVIINLKGTKAENHQKLELEEMNTYKDLGLDSVVFSPLIAYTQPGDIVVTKYDIKQLTKFPPDYFERYNDYKNDSIKGNDTVPKNPNEFILPSQLPRRFDNYAVHSYSYRDQERKYGTYREQYLQKDKKDEELVVKLVGYLTMQSFTSRPCLGLLHFYRRQAFFNKQLLQATWYNDALLSTPTKLAHMLYRAVQWSGKHRLFVDIFEHLNLFEIVFNFGYHDLPTQNLSIRVMIGYQDILKNLLSNVSPFLTISFFYQLVTIHYHPFWINHLLKYCAPQYPGMLHKEFYRMQLRNEIPVINFVQLSQLLYRGPIYSTHRFVCKRYVLVKVLKSPQGDLCLEFSKPMNEEFPFHQYRGKLQSIYLLKRVIYALVLKFNKIYLLHDIQQDKLIHFLLDTFGYIEGVSWEKKCAKSEGTSMVEPFIVNDTDYLAINGMNAKNTQLKVLEMSLFDSRNGSSKEAQSVEVPASIQLIADIPLMLNLSKLQINASFLMERINFWNETRYPTKEMMLKNEDKLQILTQIESYSAPPKWKLKTIHDYIPSSEGKKVTETIEEAEQKIPVYEGIWGFANLTCVHEFDMDNLFASIDLSKVKVDLTTSTDRRTVFIEIIPVQSVTNDAAMEEVFLSNDRYFMEIEDRRSLLLRELYNSIEKKRIAILKRNEYVRTMKTQLSFKSIRSLKKCNFALMMNFQHKRLIQICNFIQNTLNSLSRFGSTTFKLNEASKISKAALNDNVDLSNVVSLEGMYWKFVAQTLFTLLPVNHNEGQEFTTNVGLSHLSFRNPSIWARNHLHKSKQTNSESHKMLFHYQNQTKIIELELEGQGKEEILLRSWNISHYGIVHFSIVHLASRESLSVIAIPQLESNEKFTRISFVREFRSALEKCKNSSKTVADRTAKKIISGMAVSYTKSLIDVALHNIKAVVDSMIPVSADAKTSIASSMQSSQSSNSSATSSVSSNRLLPNHTTETSIMPIHSAVTIADKSAVDMLINPKIKKGLLKHRKSTPMFVAPKYKRPQSSRKQAIVSREGPYILNLVEVFMFFIPFDEAFPAEGKVCSIVEACSVITEWLQMEDWMEDKEVTMTEKALIYQCSSSYYSKKNAANFELKFNPRVQRLQAYLNPPKSPSTSTRSKDIVPLLQTYGGNVLMLRKSDEDFFDYLKELLYEWDIDYQPTLMLRKQKEGREREWRISNFRSYQDHMYCLCNLLLPLAEEMFVPWKRQNKTTNISQYQQSLIAHGLTIENLRMWKWIVQMLFAWHNFQIKQAAIESNNFKQNSYLLDDQTINDENILLDFDDPITFSNSADDKSMSRYNNDSYLLSAFDIIRKAEYNKPAISLMESRVKSSQSTTLQRGKSIIIRSNKKDNSDGRNTKVHSRFNPGVLMYGMYLLHCSKCELSISVCPFPGCGHIRTMQRSMENSGHSLEQISTSNFVRHVGDGPLERAIKLYFSPATKQMKSTLASALTADMLQDYRMNNSQHKILTVEDEVNDEQLLDDQVLGDYNTLQRLKIKYKDAKEIIHYYNLLQEVIIPSELRWSGLESVDILAAEGGFKWVEMKKHLFELIYQLNAKDQEIRNDSIEESINLARQHYGHTTIPFNLKHTQPPDFFGLFDGSVEVEWRKKNGGKMSTKSSKHMTSTVIEKDSTENVFERWACRGKISIEIIERTADRCMVPVTDPYPSQELVNMETNVLEIESKKSLNSMPKEMFRFIMRHLRLARDQEILLSRHFLLETKLRRGNVITTKYLAWDRLLEESLLLLPDGNIVMQVLYGCSDKLSLLLSDTCGVPPAAFRFISLDALSALSFGCTIAVYDVQSKLTRAVFLTDRMLRSFMKSYQISTEASSTIISTVESQLNYAILARELCKHARSFLKFSRIGNFLVSVAVEFLKPSTEIDTETDENLGGNSMFDSITLQEPSMYSVGEQSSTIVNEKVPFTDPIISAGRRSFIRNPGADNLQALRKLINSFS